MLRSMCHNMFRDHYKTHTQNKEYFCTQCSSPFGRERDLVKHFSSKKHQKNKILGDSKAGRSVSDATANDGILYIGTSFHDEGLTQATSNSGQGVEGLVLQTETNTGSEGCGLNSRGGAVRTKTGANANSSLSITPRNRGGKRTFSDINSTEGGNDPSLGSPIKSPLSYFITPPLNSEDTSNICRLTSSSVTHINGSTQFTPDSLPFHQDPGPASPSTILDIWGNYHPDPFIGYSPTQAHQNQQLTALYSDWDVHDITYIAPIPNHSYYNNGSDGGQG